MAIPLQKRPFDVFVSYRHANAERVRKVVRLLGDRELGGLEVWFDESDLQGGEPVQDAVDTGISRSRALVSFLSAESLESGWVKDEIRMANLEEKKEDGFRLVLVRLDGVELPARFEIKKFLDLPPEGPDARLTRDLLTALLGSPVTGGSGRLDVYLSRSWRDEEAELPTRVTRELAEKGFRVIGDTEDSPSFDSEEDRIQHLIRSCVGVVAALPFRPDRPESTSPHMLREIELAKQCGVPSFVVGEQGVEPVEASYFDQVPSDGADRDRIIRRLVDELGEQGLRRPQSEHYGFLATSLTQELETSECVRRAVEWTCGMPCTIGQDLGSEHAQRAIVDRIRGAQFVLADVSDGNLNSLIEAGVALGGETPLYLMARRPEAGALGTRFMFRDREIAWYRDEAEQVAASVRLARPYRRQVYASPSV